jgi:hypothetical protein
VLFGIERPAGDLIGLDSLKGDFDRNSTRD